MRDPRRRPPVPAVVGQRLGKAAPLPGGAVRVVRCGQQMPAPEPEADLKPKRVSAASRLRMRAMAAAAAMGAMAPGPVVLFFPGRLDPRAGRASQQYAPLITQLLGCAPPKSKAAVVVLEVCARTASSAPWRHCRYFCWFAVVLSSSRSSPTPLKSDGSVFCTAVRRALAGGGQVRAQVSAARGAREGPARQD